MFFSEKLKLVLVQVDTLTACKTSFAIGCMSELSSSSRADIVVAIVELDLAVSVFFQRFYSTPLFDYFRFALLLTWFPAR